MSQEQKLIDICFDIALTLHSSRKFDDFTRDEVIIWVAKQLEMCGFKTKPCGSSLGVLCQTD